jgi:hypothetical protein
MKDKLWCFMGVVQHGDVSRELLCIKCKCGGYGDCCTDVRDVYKGVPGIKHLNNESIRHYD